MPATNAPLTSLHKLVLHEAASDALERNAGLEALQDGTGLVFAEPAPAHDDF